MQHYFWFATSEMCQARTILLNNSRDTKTPYSKNIYDSMQQIFQEISRKSDAVMSQSAKPDFRLHRGSEICDEIE